MLVWCYMNDREFIELINVDIDGVLDSASRARLEQHLAEHPEADRQRAELRALDNLLTALPEEEPPADILDKVMAAREPSAKRESRPQAKVHQLFPSSLKPVLSMAAAILVAVALVNLAPSSFDPTDMKQASGTVVKAPDGVLLVERPGLSASVSLEPVDKAVRLIIKLDSISMTSTLIEVPEELYQLQPDPAAGTALKGVILKGNSLIINSVGKYEATALLQPARGRTISGNQENSIRVQFMQDHRVKHESMLELPAQGHDRK